MHLTARNGEAVEAPHSVFAFGLTKNTRIHANKIICVWAKIFSPKINRSCHFFSISINFKYRFKLSLIFSNKAYPPAIKQNGQDGMLSVRDYNIPKTSTIVKRKIKHGSSCIGYSLQCHPLSKNEQKTANPMIFNSKKDRCYIIIGSFL